MTEKKRQRMMYAIIVVAVIFGLYNQPWKRPAVEDSPADATHPPPVAQDAVESVPAIAAAGPNLSGLDWRPDPFRPAPGESVTEEVAPEISPSFVPVLQGTMAVSGSIRCVLDGKVLRVGDSIGRWRVEQVERGSVTLRNADGGHVILGADK